MKINKYKRLGQLLVDEGLITDSQLAYCLEKQQQCNKPLGEILVEEGFIEENHFLKMLGRQLGLPYVNIRQIHISDKALKIINEEVARHYNVLPIEVDENTVTIATSDPLDMSVLDDLYLLTNYQIKMVIASNQAIQWGINRYYLPQENIKKLATIDQEELTVEENIVDEDGPTIAFVQSVISKGVAMNSSDIHIEPHEQEMIVRYRIDGILYDIMPIPNDLKAMVISRLKIMANMRITEKRKPQDGGFHLEVDGRMIDIRMSTIPTLFGEKVVLRLLEKESIFQLNELGFSQESLRKLHKMLSLPHGIILVTGPTGSGKTTSLYAMLNEINNLEKNIVTIEDPIEYVLPRINQTQVNLRAGMTFSAGLRSILRQDPDVIMIGEIRDEETAKIAVQAALTGHLVISTLHTNTALGSVSRLINMGIEPYLLATALKGMIAQRLVRKICPRCSEQVKIDLQVLQRFNWLENVEDATFYKGKGCFHCQQSGYRGRIGVQEVIETDQSISSLINEKAAEEEMKQRLMQENRYRSIADDGLEKAANGMTTIEEIIRVLQY